MACGCLDIGCVIACGVVELDLVATKEGVVSMVLSSPNHTTIMQDTPGTGGKVKIDGSRLRESQVYELKAFYNDGSKLRVNEHECFQFRTELPNLL